MKYNILIVCISFLVCSCALVSKNQRCTNKLNYVMEHCPDMIGKKKMGVELDSTIKAQKIEGKEKIKIDSSGTDSLLTSYQDSVRALLNIINSVSPDDTGRIRELEDMVSNLKKDTRDKIFRNTKESISIKPIKVDSLDVKFNIWVEDGDIKYAIEKKEQKVKLKTEVEGVTINPCADPAFYEDPWFWLFAIVLILLFLVLLKKR